MIQEHRVRDTVITDRPRAPVLRYRPFGKQLLRVLDRAARDDTFAARLSQEGSKALRAYDLTSQERAAILSGDIRWIETYVGKLSPQQRRWLYQRLQREAW